MDIKQRLEDTEYKTLSPFAQKSAESKGRQHDISPCGLRTEFQRDRDRILHSQSFRCLKHKTQVFISPAGDYFRTRLTHTLEVSQIARTISRALKLNEDLTEAIALGHDLGHTPFGHAGERALKACAGTFEHNEQSLRIVDLLENGSGMNLTWEVRDGILNHRTSMCPATLEGMVVNYSDKIAYLNHDIDDAIRAGVMKAEDIPRYLLELLGDTHGKRIDTMINDIINKSMDKNEVSMSETVSAATEELRDFMFRTVYNADYLRSEEPKIINGIKMLFEYYLSNQETFYDEHKISVDRFGLKQAVIDHIASMSDRFAMNKFKEFYVPQIWM